jgi:Rv0078B-related antitoxin
MAHTRTFTDEVLDDAMAAILRQKTPAERLAIAFRMWAFAQQMVRETLRREHPEWDDAELRRQVARRMSGMTADQPEARARD